jgi:hypothetical protein
LKVLKMFIICKKNPVICLWGWILIFTIHRVALAENPGIEPGDAPTPRITAVSKINSSLPLPNPAKPVGDPQGPGGIGNQGSSPTQPQPANLPPQPISQAPGTAADAGAIGNYKDAYSNLMGNVLDPNARGAFQNSIGQMGMADAQFWKDVNSGDYNNSNVPALRAAFAAALQGLPANASSSANPSPSQNSGGPGSAGPADLSGLVQAPAAASRQVGSDPRPIDQANSIASALADPASLTGAANDLTSGFMAFVTSPDFAIPQTATAQNPVAGPAGSDAGKVGMDDSIKSAYAANGLSSGSVAQEPTSGPVDLALMTKDQLRERIQAYFANQLALAAKKGIPSKSQKALQDLKSDPATYDRFVENLTNKFFEETHKVGGMAKASGQPHDGLLFPAGGGVQRKLASSQNGTAKKDDDKSPDLSAEEAKVANVRSLVGIGLGVAGIATGIFLATFLIPRKKKS